jgi:hypothetical protein
MASAPESFWSSSIAEDGHPGEELRHIADIRRSPACGHRSRTGHDGAAVRMGALPVSGTEEDSMANSESEPGASSSRKREVSPVSVTALNTSARSSRLRTCLQRLRICLTAAHQAHTPPHPVVHLFPANQSYPPNSTHQREVHEMSMMTAKPGDKVAVHYTGKLADGSVFDTSKERSPLQFVLGQRGVIPGFDKAIKGMSPGQTKTAQIPASDDY